jgi:limonene-1,2-epoxide hydrolase
MAMTSNEDIVRDFIAAWSRLNVDEIVDFFTADGIYHNMMSKPVSGHDALRRFIGGFIANWTATDWEIVNILAHGDLVIAEHVDRTKVKEKQVDLPCCGIFELSGGKIRQWRDYFDLATYTSAVS